jgi:hypothetical protein
MAPDGTMTANLLIDNTAAGQGHRIYYPNISCTGGNYYTASVYVKPINKPKFSLFLYSGSYSTTVSCFFDLTTAPGSIVSGTGTVTYIGNGWYRLTATAIISTTSTYSLYLEPDTATSGGAGFQGTGWMSQLIWGAQVESGQMVTSYIPTTAAQATRDNDIAYINGSNFLSWYRQDEGTWAVTAVGPKGVTGFTGTNYHFINVTPPNGDSTLSYQLRYDAARSVTTWGSILTTADNWAIGPQAGSYYSAGVTNLITMGYATNNVSLFQDGIQIGSTDTSVIVRADMGYVQIGAAYGPGQFLNSTLKKLAFYPKRLTDAQLQGLTLT